MASKGNIFEYNMDGKRLKSTDTGTEDYAKSSSKGWTDRWVQHIAAQNGKVTWYRNGVEETPRFAR